MEIKRSIELRIKKRVKARYINGKFQNLMQEVIANDQTLQDSYDIIRVNSNVDLASPRDGICFQSVAEKLKNMDFDVGSYTRRLSAKGSMKDHLVLPKLELVVIQEAIRNVLEIVYRPHFSRISHGCRSGRGHHSALRYITEEIHKPSWWFTLHVNKEIDTRIFFKLISLLKERIDDESLCSFIGGMFDTQALNLCFGGFPKGHGLPQEGILSPILMNIYMDMFDREFFRVCMEYEGYGLYEATNDGNNRSKLRNWFRRQIKGCLDNSEQSNDSGHVRLHACRYIDEIFISVSGSREIASRVKGELTSYLQNSLYLSVEDRNDILEVRNHCLGIQFLGTVVQVAARETDAFRIVHRLKDKIKLFASQKQEIWDAGTVRIGKKWLAYGLKRIKESEIRNLGLSTPMLDDIARHRKDGMKTDHWFKSLLQIWLQAVDAEKEASAEIILAKYIAEPALPKELRESFYKFQQKARDYVLSETNSTSALLPILKNSSGLDGIADEDLVTKVEAPISFIIKSLHRYGLISIEGYARPVSDLLLQDDTLIIAWFSGLVCRWLKWYSECDNFKDVKLMIVECIRKSCIRTLAAKHRLHETLVEKRFDSELSHIPVAEDLDIEGATPAESASSSRDEDEALSYGILHSGLCMLSLSSIKVPTRIFNCFVVGCVVSCPSMYTLHIKERQRFPGWNTGFLTSVHPSLNGRRIGLCSKHVKDLYLGNISLQSIEFGSLSK